MHIYICVSDSQGNYSFGAKEERKVFTLVEKHLHHYHHGEDSQMSTTIWERRIESFRINNQQSAQITAHGEKNHNLSALVIRTSSWSWVRCVLVCVHAWESERHSKRQTERNNWKTMLGKVSPNKYWLLNLSDPTTNSLLTTWCCTQTHFVEFPLHFLSPCSF